MLYNLEYIQEDGSYYYYKVEEKDKCVLCGKITSYLESDNISKREWYIEGAGQLCEGCYVEKYRK